MKKRFISLALALLLSSTLAVPTFGASALTEPGGTRDLVLLPDVPAAEPEFEMIPAENDILQLMPEDGEAMPQQPQAVPEAQPGPFIPAERLFDRVVDQAGVLSVGELTGLCAQADTVSERYQCDVAVAIVNNVDGRDAQACADDFYDYNGYGYGDDDSGIMLLVDVEDRVFAMTTYSRSAWVFTDHGLEWLEGQFIGSLGGNDWAGAAEAFISGCAQLLETAQTSQPYDVPTYYEPSYYEPSRGITAAWAAGVLALGFGIGCVPVAVMKRKMNHVQLNSGAADYVRRDSFRLSYKKDRYLRSTLTKTPRPKENNRSGGGGGSSMHFSSSGRSHGGRSGRF